MAVRNFLVTRDGVTEEHMVGHLSHGLWLRDRLHEGKPKYPRLEDLRGERVHCWASPEVPLDEAVTRVWCRVHGSAAVDDMWDELFVEVVAMHCGGPNPPLPPVPSCIPHHATLSDPDLSLIHREGGKIWNGYVGSVATKQTFELLRRDLAGKIQQWFAEGRLSRLWSFDIEEKHTGEVVVLPRELKTPVCDRLRSLSQERDHIVHFLEDMEEQGIELMSYDEDLREHRQLCRPIDQTVLNYLGIDSVELENERSELLRECQRVANALSE